MIDDQCDQIGLFLVTYFLLKMPKYKLNFWPTL